MSTQQFKDNAVAFMSRNVILVDAVPDKGDGEKPLRRFKLELVPNIVIDHRAGGGVYNLVPAEPDEVSFQSYWCPYRENHAVGAFLQSTATVMFTATMNGCSFGIGSPAPCGGRMVYHANRLNDGRLLPDQDGKKSEHQAGFDRQSQAQTQLLLETDHANLGADRIITPNVYIGNKGKLVPFVTPVGKVYVVKYRSTTVGLRHNTEGWHFFTLRYRVINKRKYQHGGCRRFVTGD